MLNAFTVDVEDYFQVSAFECRVPRAQWNHYPSRVVENTHNILRLLYSHNIQASFFVLGWVARHFPELVRDIQRDGHEIGSHSYWHRLIYEQTPQEFLDDLKLSLGILEDILSMPVTAYRAPSFSITPRSLWAIGVLADQGVEIDSSVFPIRHDRYGLPNSIPHIHRVTAGARSLWEFPPTTVRVLGMNVPVGGGGYLRLYPMPLTLKLLKARNQSGLPFLVYVHPWEIDPQQPHINGVPWKSRFRHRVNLGTTEARLELLLQTFRFSTMSDVIRRHHDSLPETKSVDLREIAGAGCRGIEQI